MLDFTKVGGIKNTLLNNFLSTYVELKLIQINKDVEGRPQEYVGTLNGNFYLKEEENDLGVKIEKLHITPDDELDNEELIKNTQTFELRRKDGSFIRYDKTGGGFSERKPPLMELITAVKMNKQDTQVIT